MEVTCGKCKEDCEVEFDRLDPNDTVAWCDNCNDYAQGFDGGEYAADIMADMGDAAMDRIKEGD